MHCPSIKELPIPESDQTGWPWTGESCSLPVTMANGRFWPKISIVTPNLNQGQYLEETIRSVLLQGYPNLEYIIIDGGSSDNSLEIIKKYERWLAYWKSRPDNGQSHAINKGFANATGDWFGYLNSDDLYECNALSRLSVAFSHEEDVRLIAGECSVFEGEKTKRIFKPWWPQDLSYFIKKTYSSTFAQPSSFWDQNSYLQAGGFDESLNYCFDREFYLRLGLLGIRPYFIHTSLSRFREHINSKTISQSLKFHEESIRILEKHSQNLRISNLKQAKWRRRMKSEIQYSEVFSKWDKEGRLRAIRHFASMILKNPSLVMQRKILGQARRLFTFREKDVVELSSQRASC
jgi:glycosyltransferase involved in cell wall biosynthesis